MICCSVNGNTLSCFFENASVWSRAYFEAGSLDSENASNPLACGPFSSNVTTCR
ncbi:hypothetical protein D3C84_1276720 [compost metagenome]